MVVGRARCRTLPPCPEPALGSVGEQQLREREVDRRRYLEVLWRRGMDQHPPPCPLDQHRLVSRSGGPTRVLGERPAQDIDAEYLRRLRRPESATIEVLDTTRSSAGRLEDRLDGPVLRPSAGVGLLDGVGDRRSGDGAVDVWVGSKARPGSRSGSGVSSGRAASWMATNSVPTAASAFETDSGPGLASGNHAEVAPGQIVHVAGRGRPQLSSAPSSAARKAAIDHSTIGLPASGRKAFGPPAPSLSPEPRPR